MKKKVCPKCNIPLIEEETPVWKTWWCIVCGYREVTPKQDMKWKRKSI